MRFATGVGGLTKDALGSIVQANSNKSNIMSDVMIEQPEVCEFPFGYPDPNAVAAASGAYFALSSYAQAIEAETVLLEGIDPAVVEDATDTAWYMYRRACFGSIRSLGDVPVSLSIKYAPACQEREDAPTGAFAAPPCSVGEVTPDVQRELEEQGSEMALYEAYEASKLDAQILETPKTYSENHLEVLRVALIHSAAITDTDWRRDEAIWLADYYGLEDTAELLADMRMQGSSSLSERLVSAFAGLARNAQLVTALSRLALLNR